MMRLLAWSVLAVVLVCGTLSSQFKTKMSDEPSVSQSLVRSDDGGLLFGWFDPGKLKMAQSFSMSYQTFGQNGFALGVYTNSLSYQVSEPLSLQMDVSLMHSPYNSIGGDFGKSLSGIYLSRAELNYKPSDNMLFQIQFRHLPPGLYYGGYGYNGMDWGLDRF
jgi:hypothetical protein